MLEHIDEALTSLGGRTMMDVQEVMDILLDLRLATERQSQGETDGFLPEGADALVGASQHTG